MARCAAELGRTACAEGWGIALFEFVAEHGRSRPRARNMDGCRAQAAEIAAAKADMARVLPRRPHPQSSTF